MNSRSAKVREIFDQAAEIASEPERATYLDVACANDPNMRSEVDALLKAYGDAGSFLDRPALDAAALSKTEQTEAFDSTPVERPNVSAPTQGDSAAQRDDDPLAFLTPSAKPGHLGRLGHYEIQQVLGKGGFGTVLKAFDEKLHRVVAIKVLAPELAASGTARNRFIREARTAAAVSHDHVVTIHVVDEEHRPPYIVMQLIDGVTLQQKLDKVGALSLKEILRIGMQMAEGLAAAHKQGLVHRDIKPANVLLENGVERVKITDFGLARAVDDASITQSGTVAGTPMYMSPEQAEGVPIDHRSDLFSLGTVMYAMCTGNPPFRASGTHAVLKRVIDAAPRPIGEINNEIPNWLCDIIAKLHAKKPEDRIQTAREVADLLGQRLADVQSGRAVQSEASPVQGLGAVSPAAPAKKQGGVPLGTKLTMAIITLGGLGLVCTAYALPNPSPVGTLTAMVVGSALGIIAVTILVMALVTARRWVKLAGMVLVCGLAGAASVPIWDYLVRQAWRGNTPPQMEPHEVLDRLVGTWSVQFETSDPDHKTAHGKVRYERVANNKFLRAYSNTDDGRESLTVVGYDPDTKAWRRWSFARWAFEAVPGPVVYESAGKGEWDATAATLTWRAELPLAHKVVHQERWIDADNFETQTEIKNALGAVVFQETKHFHRLTSNEAVGPQLPADSKRPAELAVLERTVGKWTSDNEAVLAEMGDEKVKWRSPHEWTRFLAGLFFEARCQTGEHDEYMITGYDQNRKIFRFWHFAPDGDAMEADGTFEKAENKITWKSLDGRLTGVWTFPGPDERRGAMAVKDAQGRRKYEVVAISRREGATEPGWVRLFNGNDLTGWISVQEQRNRLSPWDIVDGILVGKGQPLDYLRTTRKYREFHLSLEYRHPVVATDPVLYGMVFWEVGNENVEAFKYPVPTMCLELTKDLKADPIGIMYSAEGKPLTPVTVFKGGPAGPDRWNHLDIVCKNGALEVRINGVRDTMTNHQALEIVRKYSAVAVPIDGVRDTMVNHQASEGYLALHCVGAGLHFRNIRIRELSATKTAEASGRSSNAHLLLSRACTWPTHHGGHDCRRIAVLTNPRSFPVRF